MESLKLKSSTNLKVTAALIQPRPFKDFKQSTKNAKLGKNTLASKKTAALPTHMSTLQLMQKTFSQNNIGK
jgi:hypothetical protein